MNKYWSTVEIFTILVIYNKYFNIYNTEIFTIRNIDEIFINELKK